MGDYFRLSIKDKIKFDTQVTLSQVLITGYQSPIDLLYDNFVVRQEESMEALVMKAVQDVQIDINREELLCALRYDRGQYNKGFETGYAGGLSKGEKIVLDRIREAIFGEGKDND